MRFLDEIIRHAPDPDDVATVEASKLLARGRKVRFSFIFAGGHVTDVRADDAGPRDNVVRKTWVRGVLDTKEEEVCRRAREEGWQEESRDERHIRFVKKASIFEATPTYPDEDVNPLGYKLGTRRHGESDGKIHVRKGGVPADPALCGKPAQTTTSSAEGWWGPDGKGWEHMCRECHRIEFNLEEPLP